MVFYHNFISPLQSSFRNAFLHYCDIIFSSLWLYIASVLNLTTYLQVKAFFLPLNGGLPSILKFSSSIWQPKGKTNERTKKLRRLALLQKSRYYCKVMESPYILYWTKWKERKPSKAAKDRESGLFGGLHFRILHIVQNLWPARKHTQHFFLLYFWTTNWYLVS